MAMNEALNQALQDPSFVELTASSGATPEPVTPEEFVAVIEEEKAILAEFLENVDLEG